MKTYNCAYCGKENKWSARKTNKYCDNACQGKHRWETLTIPKIDAGCGADPITLKKYLVEKRGSSCEECGQVDSWNNKPLTMHLDHIDGNSDNNVVTNIRLLCPNCHTQTDTYGAKGQGVRYHKKDTKRNRYMQEYFARD